MFRLPAFLLLVVLLMTGCATRQVQDSLGGSTAQRLVTHSIDELMDALPAEDFEPLRNHSLWLDSNFIEDGPLKQYADQRLQLALEQRFGISFAKSKNQSDARLTVFYTSLGTDQDLAGFYLPIGVIPGFQEQTQINLITLQKFHGIAELFYFIESEGLVERGTTLQRRIKTDALGLPIITIPLSGLPDGPDRR